jgi:hypothetical protein
MVYGAWNKKQRRWVKWLGYTKTKSKMNGRLHKYKAPDRVTSRRIPKSSKWF